MRSLVAATAARRGSVGRAAAAAVHSAPPAPVTEQPSGVAADVADAVAAFSAAVNGGAPATGIGGAAAVAGSAALGSSGDDEVPAVPTPEQLTDGLAAPRRPLCVWRQRLKGSGPATGGRQRHALGGCALAYAYSRLHFFMCLRMLATRSAGGGSALGGGGGGPACRPSEGLASRGKHSTAARLAPAGASAPGAAPVRLSARGVGRRCAGHEALRSCSIPDSELWTSPAARQRLGSLQGFAARARQRLAPPSRIMRALLVLLVAALACQPALGEP